MVQVEKRRVTRTGSGLTICLPHKFTKEHRLQPGDQIVVVYNGFLQVIPIRTLQKEGRRIVKDEAVIATIKEGEVEEFAQGKEKDASNSSKPRRHT
jgi:antitoxin component of MazEF toxin-antitoxin module